MKFGGPPGEDGSVLTEERRPWYRSRILAGTTVGVVGSLFLAAGASAAGLDTYPTDPAEAEASVVDMALADTDLFGVAQSHAGSVQDPGPNQEAFSGSLAGTEIVDFGAGYEIPLDQLIAFGEAGALLSESTATDAQNAEAISGIAGADGGLTLDGTDGDFGTASLDMLSLFDAAGVDSITDQMIDEAELNFGLGGAWVQSIDGIFQDPDLVGELGQYRAGALSFDLHSPAIEAASTGVSDGAGQMEAAVIDEINSLLDVASLVSLVPGASLDLEITSDIQQDVLDAVLLAPISTDDGLATIDLGTGSLTVDVGRIGGNDDGVIDRPVGINNQDPNTELIDSDTYPFIASSIHDVIERVVQVAVDAAVESLQSVEIDFDGSLPIVGDAAFTIDLTGDIVEPCTGTACAAFSPIISAAQTAMGPIYDALSDPSGLLYDAFTTIKTDMITVPIRAAIDPFLELIAGNLLSVQLNHQETEMCTLPDGSDTVSGLEVSALSIGVAGGTARLGIGNAGVRVDACGLAALTPELEAASPAPAGSCVDITSSGWNPETDVTLQLTDATGAPVGEPVTVTTDADGNVPADTCVTIPEGTNPGDFTIVGTDPDGTTAEAPLAVYSPELAASTPVAPGECSDITSGGWMPDSEVTLQLTDAAGTPVGEPVTATADADGNVPADTCVTIPDGTTPGDYEIVGTDANGAEVTSPIEVVDADADAPVIEASSPVPAGGESEVSSSGWTPNTDVMLQLTDADGAPLGEPVTATTDADGNLPAGTIVPIPADIEPGEYAIVGTDPDGTTAQDAIDVYAPTLDATSPVSAGDDTEITSGGWAPE
ncbi:MAG: choice-of-anchor G family protein, partial [Pseudoclavibacter sp.]